jgi:hypothetical protein
LSSIDADQSNEAVCYVASGIVYVGVLAFGEEKACRARVSIVAKNDDSGGGRTLIDGGAAVADAVNVESDTSICSLCTRRVPTASLTLHQLGCQRNNFTCERCHETMELRARAKHEQVRHRRVTCPLGCDATLDADVIHRHRREYCRRRAVACLYCPMRVPIDERGAHQNQCGARSATCLACGHSAQRKLLKKHNVEQHGIFPKDVTPKLWH